MKDGDIPAESANTTSRTKAREICTRYSQQSCSGFCTFVFTYIQFYKISKYGSYFVCTTIQVRDIELAQKTCHGQDLYNIDSRTRQFSSTRIYLHLKNVRT